MFIDLLGWLSWYHAGVPEALFQMLVVFFKHYQDFEGGWNLLSQIIGGKLFKVEGETLSAQSPQLLNKIGAAMESVDFCSKCESLGGEMSLFFDDLVVKIDWNTQKITVRKPD